MGAGTLALLGADVVLLVVLSGLAYFVLRGKELQLRRRRAVLTGAAAAFALLAALVILEFILLGSEVAPASDVPGNPNPSLDSLFISGFRTGMLTFGGAYTAIPFLQRDATGPGGWMTQAQFLDGLALGGILPAPLIIFSTFVGYLGGGPVGALVMTVAIFLPAFLFTIIGHDFFERVVENRTAQVALDAVTAGVVGLVAATAMALSVAALAPMGAVDPYAIGIFAIAIAVLFWWKSKLSVVGTVLGGGGLGLVRILLLP
jgi:chromate transporter